LDGSRDEIEEDLRMRKQLIVAVKFRRGPANDSPDFIWTLSSSDFRRLELLSYDM